MRADDLSPLLTAAGRPQIGMRQGVLNAWNASTGANTVTVAGQVFTDLPILASSTLAMAPGDQIALLRFGSTYFILGTIRPAGVGTLAIRAAKVEAQESTTSASYVDLATVGPRLVDVYIGPSRQCLVLLTAAASVVNGQAAMDFTVTGASSIAVNTVATNPASIGAPTAGQLIGSITSNTVLTAANGLNEGLNTFTCKYSRYSTASGGSAATFRDRAMTVIPF